MNISAGMDVKNTLSFDVCADDHCQRYQGIPTTSRPEVLQAINETRGLVLMSEGDICDARFSKCCGGMTERFSSCWEDQDEPYLVATRDLLPKSYNEQTASEVDLTNEQQATAWIKSTPAAFCHTQDQTILAQILNDYDQETADFYRWEVSYSQEEISHLIQEKLGLNLGNIKALIPIERGDSGRIIRLKLVGTDKTMTIGKELEIRRALSHTHLYSSAFVVETSGETAEGLPANFHLYGAGWGHGVGLCQIGAAMMGAEGYNYEEILLHYYKNATIEPSMNNSKRHPLSWIPSLYFVEGLPYIIVAVVSLIMFKRFGLSDTESAAYSAWLSLPWVIKPLWSPIVEMFKTKRWWILTMQALMSMALSLIAFSIPTSYYVQASLALFFLIAFSSATHDISADGFYMTALDEHDQAQYVGIRSTFYRLSTIFTEGLLLMYIGNWEVITRNVPLAWSIGLGTIAILLFLTAGYHLWALPKVEHNAHETNIVSLLRKQPKSLEQHFLRSSRNP